MKRIVSLAFAFAAWSVVAGEGGTLAKPNWRTEILSSGVAIYRADVDDPKALRLNAVKVDLKSPGIRFTGTEKCVGYGTPLDEAKSIYEKAKGKKEKCSPCDRRTAIETTPDFFARCARPVESGGRGLDMLVAFGSGYGGVPYSKGFACPDGLIISDGIVVTDTRRHNSSALVVRKDGSADIVDKLSPAEYPNVAFARSGYKRIRKEGKDVTPPGGTIRGRLAAGLTADRRYLYIVTADTGDLARAGNDGVDYHQLNALLAGFDVTDAIAFSFARNCELVVKDRKGGVGRILNGYDKPSSGSQVNCGIYCLAAKDVERMRKAVNPVEAKFSTPPRLSQATESGSRCRVLKGQVKVAFSTELMRIKRPMLNVIALYEYNGTWRIYDVLCADMNTSGGILAVQKYKTAQYSNWQPEVDSAAWKSVTFGDPKSAFFAGYGIPDKAKPLLYRLEVWQGGQCLAEYDSDPKLVKKLALPDDWHVKGRHTGKFIYKYPPEEKK